MNRSVIDRFESACVDMEFEITRGLSDRTCAGDIDAEKSIMRLAHKLMEVMQELETLTELLDSATDKSKNGSSS